MVKVVITFIMDKSMKMMNSMVLVDCVSLLIVLLMRCPYMKVNSEKALCLDMEEGLIAEIIL